jgi:hypothetical protein
MKLIQFAFLSLSAAVLAACGGGGGGNSPAPSSTAEPIQPLAMVAGTYSLGCTLDFTDTVNGTTERSIQNIVVNSDGSVSYRLLSYLAPLASTTPCATSNLDIDATFIGEAILLNSTKTIASTGSGTKTGVAQIAEFKFTGLKLTKGSIGGSIPTFGTKTKVGFLIEGSKLFVLRGSRKSDGLPESFSTTVFNKQ